MYGLTGSKLLIKFDDSIKIDERPHEVVIDLLRGQEIWDTRTLTGSDDWILDIDEVYGVLEENSTWTLEIRDVGRNKI